MMFGIEPFKTQKVKGVQCEGEEINCHDKQEENDAGETDPAKSVLKLLSDFLDSEVRSHPALQLGSICNTCLCSLLEFCTRLLLTGFYLVLKKNLNLKCKFHIYYIFIIKLVFRELKVLLPHFCYYSNRSEIRTSCIEN